jgi:ribonuclease R
MVQSDMPKSSRGPSGKNRRRPFGAKKHSGRGRAPSGPKKPRETPTIPGPSAVPAAATDPALAARVLQLVRKQRKSPPSMGEIARGLRLSPGQAPALARALHDLELAGDVVRVRQDQFALPTDVDLVVGTIQTHRDGSAHLLRDQPGEKEFYLTPENTATALPGDRVVVRHLRDQPPYRGYQPCGRVIRILKRGTTTAVGTLEKSARFWHVVPDDKHFVHNIYVPQPAPPLRPNQGDKVVVKLGEWKSRHVNPEGEIVEVLGPSDKPGVDIESIIRKFDLPTRFPEAVLAEAKSYPPEVPASAARGREDCRNTLVITIDPDDARDFDDAIHVERTKDGWRLTVHVADVSHYVRPGTPLDHEAYKRGNSVYLPDRVIPMLPETLSNGLCSLRPDEDRLTFAAFMDITREGKIRKSRFAKCIIRSARRFTYKEAFARLQAKPADRFDRMLHEAWAMASTLRKKRFDEGSLDLDFPEVKVWLDDQGRPARLERIENDISHQLIEECMLAANEAVARLFRMQPAAAIHRVHEKPDEAKLNEYRERVQMHGHKVGNLSVRKELTRFLKMLRGQPEEYALKTALLKSLKRASYSPEPAGHYGLAKSDYTHFTSPIRRYADLVVHRVLSDVCGYTKPKGRIPFGEIARHISTTERNAAEAEREAVRLKKFEFFRQQLAKRTGKTFKAIVLEVRNFGMFVELPEVMAGGLVHVSALGDDFYTFDQARQRFVGRKKKKTYQAGDELEVIVARVDPFKQQLDFAPA